MTDGFILTFAGNDLLIRVRQHLNLKYLDGNKQPEPVRSNQWQLAITQIRKHEPIL